MFKVLRKSGKTEDEALRLALEELKLDRDDVSVEIIERAKSGFLGIGSSPAVIAVTYEAPDEPEPPKPAPPKQEPVKPEPPAPKQPAKPEPRQAQKPEPISAVHESPVHEPPAQKSPKAAQKPESGGAIHESPVREPRQTQSAHTTRDATGENKSDKVREFLTGLTERMGVQAEINVGEERDGAVSASITSGEPGALIGRHGETLDAIQSLANYAVNRGARQRLRVIVDAENYRERRGETLEALAQRTAAKVARYRRSVTLDPMNAYERHVIHAALQEHESVSTHSVGSEPNRRVVVTYGKTAQSAQYQQQRPERRNTPKPEPRRVEEKPSSAKKPNPVEKPNPEMNDTDGYASETKNFREWK